MKMLGRSAAFLTLGLACTGAYASAFDDAAVIRHCGAPISQDRQRSQATNEFTEDFFYPGDVVIHFLPVDGGWQLSSAWLGHIPVTRDGLANRMPCVKDALAEAALAPRPEIDPTIAAQTVQSESRRGFGIPFLWLIFFLILTLLVFIVIPTPRKRVVDLPAPRAPQRLPDVVVQERIRQSSASHATAGSLSPAQAFEERAEETRLEVREAEERSNLRRNEGYIPPTDQVEASRNLTREEYEESLRRESEDVRASASHDSAAVSYTDNPVASGRESRVVTWGPPR